MRFESRWRRSIQFNAVGGTVSEGGGLDEGLEGAQEHLADAGEPRALLPLVDSQAAGCR